MNGTEIELFFPSKKKLKLQRRKLFSIYSKEYVRRCFSIGFICSFGVLRAPMTLGDHVCRIWPGSIRLPLFCFLSFFNLFATSAKHVRPLITSLIRLSLTDTLFLNKRMQLYKGFPCNFFSRKYISMPLSITRVTYHSCTKPI